MFGEIFKTCCSISFTGQWSLDLDAVNRHVKKNIGKKDFYLLDLFSFPNFTHAYHLQIPQM